MSFFKKIFGGKDAETENKTTGAADVVLAIMDGTVKPLSESEDPVFAQKMMGDGYLIEPSGNTIYSPVNGKVQVVFPTKHAVGLVSDNGDEIIIHVGLDTVTLEGKGFESFVQVDDNVKAGDKLLEVDFDYVKEHVPSIATPVVITNLGERTIDLVKEGSVQTGDTVVKINK